MLIDYHIHTKLCGHAEGEIEEYIEAAINKGLREIGIADHLPTYFIAKECRDSDVAMDEKTLERYVLEVLKLKEKYKNQITVRLGIEADFVPGAEDQLKPYLVNYPWDYVIGSIHFLNGWGFDNPRYIDQYHQWDMEQLFVEYFRVVKLAARSQLFDILGHVDLIKKFGFKPASDLSNLYRDLAKVIKDQNQSIELNTAGWRYPAQEQYPAELLLNLCSEMDIPITLGSDAHEPQQVGYNFAKASALLKKYNINTLAVWEKRVRQSISLLS